MGDFVAGLEREGTPATGLAASLRKLAEGRFADALSPAPLRDQAAHALDPEVRNLSVLNCPGTWRLALPYGLRRLWPIQDSSLAASSSICQSAGGCGPGCI